MAVHRSRDIVNGHSLNDNTINANECGMYICADNRIDI